jgi:NAD(P)-dependent dehydrogenase (short-subunit alcohol dehydrogenase family)
MKTPENLFSCRGKVAIVSGGAGLYGFAISEALAAAGATVVVASRSDRLLAEKIARREHPLPLHHRTLDLLSEASIADLFRAVRAEFGRVDIVVNNALTPVGRTLEATTTEAWTKSMQGNILSLYLMCRHASAAMIEQGEGGSIINISSIYGVVAPDFATYTETGSPPNPVDYGFIKGGMLMFTRTLASALGRHRIRVNSIIPGGIHDDSDSPAYIKAYARKVPLGRWAQPEDIQGAILYLASDASAYVTGTSVTVDGGYTAL